MLRTSVQPFSSSLRAAVLSPAAATLPSVQPATFVRFLTFLHWLLSLLYLPDIAFTCFLYSAVTFFLHKLVRFLILYFISLNWWSRKSTVFCSTVCCSLNYYRSILFVLHKCRNFFCVAHSVHPFSSFLRASLLPPAAAILPSVQPPTFVRFLTFLYWLLSLLYFSPLAIKYFSYLAVTFYLHKLMRFLILSFISLTWWSLLALILLSVVLPFVAL